MIGIGDSVIDVFPDESSRVPNESTIVLDTESTEISMVTMPNVIGLSPTQASQTLGNYGLNVQVTGGAANNSKARVVSQEYEAGDLLERGTIVEIECVVSGEDGADRKPKDRLPMSGAGFAKDGLERKKQMLLSEILNGIDCSDGLSLGEKPGFDCEITAITCDSRQAGKGSIFVCIRGGNVDGHTFAAAALEKGAAALLPSVNCGWNGRLPSAIPMILRSGGIRLFWAPCPRT